MPVIGMYDKWAGTEKEVVPENEPLDKNFVTLKGNCAVGESKENVDWKNIKKGGTHP